MTELIRYCHFELVFINDNRPLNIAVKQSGVWTKTIEKWRNQQQTWPDAVHFEVRTESNFYKKNCLDEKSAAALEKLVIREKKLIESKPSKYLTIGMLNLVAWQLGLDILRFCGISLYHKAKDELISRKWLHPYLRNHSIYNQFSYTSSGSPTGLFSSIIQDLQGKNSFKTYTSNNINEHFNPLYYNRDVMYLAKLECNYITDDLHETFVEGYSINSYKWLNTRLGLIEKIKSDYDEICKEVKSFNKNILYKLSIVNKRQEYYDTIFTDYINILESKSEKMYYIKNLNERQKAVMCFHLYLNNTDELNTFFEKEPVENIYIIHYNVCSLTINLDEWLCEDCTLGAHNGIEGLNFLVEKLKDLFIAEALYIALNPSFTSNIISESEFDNIINSIEELKEDDDGVTINDLIDCVYEKSYEDLIRKFLASKIEEITFEFNNLNIQLHDAYNSPININTPAADKNYLYQTKLFDGREYYGFNDSTMFKSRLRKLKTNYQSEQKEGLLLSWVSFRLSEWCFHQELETLSHILDV